MKFISPKCNRFPITRDIKIIESTCTCNANDSTYITLSFIFKIKYILGHVKILSIFFFKYVLA